MPFLLQMNFFRTYPKRGAGGPFFLYAISVFILLTMQSNAQRDPLEESWRWVKFTTASGLPSNAVRDIWEGPDGTPWALTSAGLAWYDGFQWHGNEATRQLVLRGGCLIFGFFEGWVGLAVGEEIFLASRTSRIPFPVDRVKKAWVIGEDTLLLVRDGAFFRYTKETLSAFPLPWRSEDILIGIGVNSGRTFFHTRDCAVLLHGGKIIPLLQYEKEKVTISDVAENSAEQGLAIVNHPPSYTGIWEWKQNGPALRDNYRTVRQGTFAAIAENGDALVVYENEFARTRRKGKWAPVQLPVRVRDIKRIRYRPNGDLWVGTLHGLFLCRLTSERWSFHNWEESDARNRVNNIIRSRDGTLWLATSGGVVQMPRRGEAISTQSIKGKNIRIVTGLTEDMAGNIWITSGSGFTGAYCWNGKSWRHYPIEQNGEGMHAHSVVCDSKGQLWFLCVAGGWDPGRKQNPGVFLMKDDEIERWKGSDGLPHLRVFALAEGKHGDLWFGTYDGLARWKNGKWKYWSRSGGSIPGPVTTIAIDDSSRVWFGMQNQGTGLGMIDSRDTLRYFTTQDGLPADFIWDIKVDAKQRVWVTTEMGLAYLDQGKWLTFDERTGLTEALIWPVLPEDSSVYVGSRTSGWAELHMNDVQTENPRIVIDRPVIEHNQVSLGWNAYTSWGSVPPENVLTRYCLNGAPWSKWTTTHSISLENINPGDYTLQVQAKGLYGQYDESSRSISFTVPPPFLQRWYVYIPATFAAALILGLSTLLYQRRRKYVHALGESESRYRMITELMSDYAYLFQVRKDASLKLIWMTDSFTRSTGYSVQEANEANFMLRINHPDDLERAMREHRRLLDGESLHIEHRILTKAGETRWVERRSSPVYDKGGTRVEFIYGVVHDITDRKESEQRMIESELKALRAQMNPHFFFNSLNAIQSFIIMNEKKLAADYLSKFARLMRLILENSKSSLVEIRTEIELLSLYIELEAIRFDQRFESSIDLGPEVDGTAQIPSMLLQPYVENAIRHGLVHKGEGGRLSIKLHCIDHQLLCTIEDNGIGRGKAEEIRQRQGRSATSMGMQITKDRLDILSTGRHRRASVTITDLFDEAGSAAGTRVEITIPIDES